jgi:RimJ/RimL family protein N-acetyltransferase
MDTNRLETPRLMLSLLAMGDVSACVAIDSDPVVTRYTGGPASRWTRPRWLETWIKAGRPVRYGLWLVRTHGDDTALGWCGLFRLPSRSEADPELCELGYRYIEDAWGRGIATEAAARILDHGFSLLGHDRIVAVTHPENHGSQNVLEKLGMRREGERFAYGKTLPFYSLTRRSWLSREPGNPG